MILAAQPEMGRAPKSTFRRTAGPSTANIPSEGTMNLVAIRVGDMVGGSSALQAALAGVRAPIPRLGRPNSRRSHGGSGMHRCTLASPRGEVGAGALR